MPDSHCVHSHGRRTGEHETCPSAHGAGTLSTHMGVTRAIRGTRMVPRCQVRHMGTLGPAVRARGGRLVCPTHVLPRALAIRIPCQEIRRPRQVRIQGCDTRMAGREVGSRISDQALQGCRGALFRHTGQPPRQLRSVGQ